MTVAEGRAGAEPGSGSLGGAPGDRSDHNHHPQPASQSTRYPTSHLQSFRMEPANSHDLCESSTPAVEG